MTTNEQAYSTLVDGDTTVRVRPAARIGWIDGARGLSIAAMIISHIGLWSGLTPGWFHLYVMRPVAPMFLLLLGALWRPGWRTRHWHLVAAAGVASLLALVLDFAQPNIMPLIVVAVLALHVSSRLPVVALVLCIVQLAFWPVPDWWTGYPIGFVVAFATIGYLLPADRVLIAYGRVGQRLGLAVVGRAPLRFYLGHLLILAGFTYLLERGGR